MNNTENIENDQNTENIELPRSRKKKTIIIFFLIVVIGVISYFAYNEFKRSEESLPDISPLDIEDIVLNIPTANEPKEIALDRPRPEFVVSDVNFTLRVIEENSKIQEFLQMQIPDFVRECDFIKQGDVLYRELILVKAKILETDFDKKNIVGDEVEVELGSIKDFFDCEEESTNNESGMNCCQSESGAPACIVALDENCPAGYLALENEYVESVGNNNCMSGGGSLEPKCEDIGNNSSNLSKTPAELIADSPKIPIESTPTPTPTPTTSCDRKCYFNQNRLNENIAIHLKTGDIFQLSKVKISSYDEDFAEYDLDIEDAKAIEIQQ